MGWRRYAIALIAFNALGVLVVYALQRLQGVLPLNRRPWRRSAPTRHSHRGEFRHQTRTGRATPVRRR